MEHAPENIDRFSAARRELQEAVTAWVAESAGSVGTAILRCIARGRGHDALPVGLVCGVVFDPSVQDVTLAQAAVRLEEYVGRGLDAGAVARWGALANDVIVSELQTKGIESARPWLARAEQILAEGRIPESESEALLTRTNELMEQRLAVITRTAPALAAALRGYRQALAVGNSATAEALIAWLGAQPNVSGEAKRFAGVRGEIDHFGALSFLQGLLVMLRDSGHAGLLLALDEVETLQRVRSDVRDKGLNALRQLIDEVDAGRFPGLYPLVTGTPSFFDGPQGVQRLAPLAQRLQVDFSTDARFENPRAVQIRLPGFNRDALCEVGRKVRDIFAEHSANAERIKRVADDTFVTDLAAAVTGKLGGRVGIAPRIFLKKLVADILDRIDQFPDFDPRQHYALTIVDSELSDVEREAVAAKSVDDVELSV